MPRTQHMATPRSRRTNGKLHVVMQRIGGLVATLLLFVCLWVSLTSALDLPVVVVNGNGECVRVETAPDREKLTCDDVATLGRYSQEYSQ